MLDKLKNMLRKKIARSMEKNDIDSNQLEKMLGKGAILIDIRSPQEYKEGHLKNSILIPEYEIKIKAEELIKNKDEIIIVYCNSGHRSKKAQKLLNKLGYQNVYNLFGGIENIISIDF